MSTMPTDDGGWGGIATAFLGNLAGQLPAIYMANQASKRIQAGQNQASRIAQATTAAQLANQQRIEQQASAEGAPAIAYYRSVMAERPEVLRPAQQVALNDARREFANRSTLGRMGGRAVARGVSDINTRFKANAMEANRNAQGQAASQLMGRGNLGIAAGTGMTPVIGSGGEAQANLAAAGGQTQADALAAISSYFANAIKDTERDSRYKDYKTSMGS